MSNNYISNSGIKVADDGSRYVGESTRKDGTVRKAVRVRPGFIPLEDIGKYVPRALRKEQAKAQDKAYMPGALSKDQVSFQDKSPVPRTESSNRGNGLKETEEKGLESMLSKLSIDDRGERKIITKSTDDESNESGRKGKETAEQRDSTSGERDHTVGSTNYVPSSLRRQIQKKSHAETNKEDGEKDPTDRSKIYIPPSRRRQLEDDERNNQDQDDKTNEQDKRDWSKIKN